MNVKGLRSEMPRWRFIFLCILLIVALAGIVWRLIDLMVFNRPFLVRQSQARINRTVNIPAHRGMIIDRNGIPLAISTVVESAWINPALFKSTPQQRSQLCALLHLSPQELHNIIAHSDKRSFVYMKRQNPPEVVSKVQSLKISGLYFQQEYKRYYPQAEVMAHVLGFTNIDDHGQEGLELSYNSWLSGVPGKKEVIKDRLGNVVADVTLLREPEQGHNLILSIDHNLQYLAYRYLKAAVEEYQAVSGSVVILDARTGEILAMVNQPSYNPNQRPLKRQPSYRNLAVTDMFEPGSTIKPFTIALALLSGKYTPNSLIDTNPGRMEIGGYLIQEELGHNYGVLNLGQILQKSSNIGAAKIMLTLSPPDYWNLLHQFGFGQSTNSGFPGEAMGKLADQTKWMPSQIATLAYGYGIAVTAVQLVHAYNILANGGIERPISFLKLQEPPISGKRVLPLSITNMVVHMLEGVVEEGTGKRAQIPGYHVAGKTGTAYIALPTGGYDRHRYVSSFVGLAPATRPRLVVAVVIHDPKGSHFGALVAAPVFAKVMGDALRLMNIPPDDIH